MWGKLCVCSVNDFDRGTEKGNKVRYYVEKKVRRYISGVRNKIEYGREFIITTEVHGEGLEGEGLSESRVRENLTHGSTREKWKNRCCCSPVPYSTY